MITLKKSDEVQYLVKKIMKMKIKKTFEKCWKNTIRAHPNQVVKSLI